MTTLVNYGTVITLKYAGFRQKAHVVLRGMCFAFRTVKSGYMEIEYELKILICDDEACYSRDLFEKLSDYMQARQIKADISTFSCAEKVLRKNTAYDIAFLDIEMQSVNGLALAKALRQRNAHILIFFVTAFAEYQDDVMDFQAFRFYEKPVNRERLYAGLDKALQYREMLLVDVYVKGDRYIKRMNMDDILLVKTVNREICVETQTESYMQWDTLEEWERKLNAPFFYRVHNSFLINLHHVRQYSYKEIIMSNGERIPIPTRRQATFHQVWFDYLKGR